MSKRKPEPPHLDMVPPPDAQSVVHVELRRLADPTQPPTRIVHRAPLVQRASWPDPADTSAQARLRSGARAVEGWRRVWQINVMHAGSPREITEAHVKAAERLLGDYELGVEGATQGGMSNDRVDGGSAAGISGARLDALRRYREALAVLREQLSLIVCLVVIDNWTVSRLAEALGISRDRAHGRVQSGLELLREHYQPPRRTASQPPISRAPAGMLDQGVSDVPQERLGRWRASQAARETA